MPLAPTLLAAVLLWFPPSHEPSGEGGAGGGALVPDVMLDTLSGERASLIEPGSEALATVVVGVSSHCPLAARYAPRLAELAAEYAPLGVRFLGLASSTADDVASLREYVQQHGLEFPVLLDPLGAAASRIGLTRTTEVLVLDAGSRRVYQGAIDDQFDVDSAREYVGEEYLVEVLEGLLAEEEVEVAGAPAPDTPFDMTAEGTAFERVTYHRDVLPVLREQCVVCHREGRIGPMALTDFEEVRGWAPMIAEVVAEGRMPPWHASPRHGEFKNSRRLTETEKAVLARWASTGAIEGEPTADSVLPPPADEVWEIGPPDLVVELPADEEVPPEGVVDYRYVLVDPGIEEDVWVDAVEIRPSNRAVTHHVLVLQVPAGVTVDQVMGNQQFFLGSGHFAVNVPGAGPAVFPEGYAIPLEAGTKFLFQLHYTPNGTAAVDRTRMGIRFTRSPVTHPVRTRAILNTGIRIPAGEPAVTQQAEYEFQKDEHILALFPHMHARGAAFRFDLVHVGDDDTEVARTILDVPAYDFNWQHTYYYREPVAARNGDRLVLEAVYDNSEDNPFNPDPSRNVYWGDQTWEEMLVGYVTYVDAD